jgi:imidazolonepropionase-like amidohydrolase
MQSTLPYGGPIAVRFGVLHDNVSEPTTNGVLVTDGDRVTSIGNADMPIPDGALVLDAAAVVPGLINAHVHLEMSGEAATMSVFVLTTPTQRAFACAHNARLALESGVTTMRDLRSSEKLAIELRDAIMAGKASGPAIVAAGRAICMTGGHGWFIGREADGPLASRVAVREHRRDGAECINFIATGGVLTKGAVPGISQLDEDELRAGIDEGGALLMAERGTFLVPTLCAIDRIVEAGCDAGLPEFVLTKARVLAEKAAENLLRARAAGVRFAGGSDAGTPFNPHDGFALELELMQSWLGMSAREALRAATLNAAELLDIDRGTLAAGGIADMIFLKADITSDSRPYREPRAAGRDQERTLGVSRIVARRMITG